MSMSDFEAMTPEEFGAVASSHAKREENNEKREWERVRTAVTILLQPHTKKRLKADDVLKFPWEKEEKEEKEVLKSTEERFKDVSERIRTCRTGSRKTL